MIPALRFLTALFAIALSLPGQALGFPEPRPSDGKLHAPKLYEKAAMKQIKSDGWFSMMGGWDTEGRAFIKDLAYMTRWDPNLFQLSMHSPLRAEFTDSKGEIQNKGITLLEASEGTLRAWSSHLGIPFATKGDVVEFKVLGAGFKPLPVKLEWNVPGDPRLRIWEEAGDKLRWEVKEAWFVHVEVTVNDGESWVTLGRGNEGVADLRPYLGRDPVVRIQAFRGLRCYVDAFEPGQGILGAPWSYLRPTFFQEGTKDDGRATLSRYPNFDFVADTSRLPVDYAGKVKVHLHWKRLPFNPEKLFLGKCIQMVFQAEWKHLPQWPLPSMTINATLLLHPEHTKEMKLYRITRGLDGIWGTSLFFELKPDNNMTSYQAEYDYYGLLSARFVPKNLTIDFDSYWVLVSN